MSRMGIKTASDVDFDAIDKLLAEPPAKANVQLQRLKEREASERQIVALQNSLREKPDDLVKLNALAYELRKLERTAEVVDVYRRILALDPGRVDLQHMLDAATGGRTPSRASDDYVRAEFDGFADKFDSVLTNWLEYRAPEIVVAAVRRVLGDEAANQVTIDLGCGTGLAGPLLRPLSRRLEGIDLSPKMVEKAEARGGYDALVVSEIGKYLATRRNAYTLAVACDVFCYFGELAEVFHQTHDALKPRGLFAFTVERNSGDGFLLQSNGRYAHADRFVRETAAAAGFDVADAAEVQLRVELHKPVMGGCYVLRRR
ncbi:MAG: methyltransferase domain-containing protein [Alphaproteobacteria bacterium]|nr:methyltransferase domain-containing protein [Alphaproteobacteria bacterium]